MSRYVCGSHELKSNASIVPPKNWEARSWSGDGRRPSGALHSLFCALDRACSPLPLPQSVWLPWPWWSIASSYCP
ncbi:unnamed protein product [Microthlaspi erraticum]|uniref:Uncharacterized protein n=1 Tax=Microthlaspi erraticum TaxID=1685480 RepID=A0A6D2HDY9_9BRAS|nr:unnamed protein product [Microthlaspi erraticum]